MTDAGAQRSKLSERAMARSEDTTSLMVRSQSMCHGLEQTDQRDASRVSAGHRDSNRYPAVSLRGPQPRRAPDPARIAMRGSHQPRGDVPVTAA